MATTWAATSPSPGAKATYSTGSESAPTLVTEGMSLVDVTAFGVHIEAGSAFGSSASLVAYLWNDVSGVWNRAPELDLTPTSGATATAFSGFEVPSGRGRIAYAQSSGVAGAVLYINASRGG